LWLIAEDSVEFIRAFHFAACNVPIPTPQASKSLYGLEVVSPFMQHSVSFGKFTCEISYLPAQQI
jgi:hypothetical protein